MIIRTGGIKWADLEGGDVMPSYLTLDSDPAIPPPYSFPGVTIQSFRLAAQITQLQALCDRYLNIGSLQDRGFEYRAFLPFVDLEFLIYPRMQYGLPPFSGWGSAKQEELYFKVFVAKFVLVGGILLPAPAITCFFPYIFVNNAWSLIAGREVIGFPKLLGEFHHGNAAANPYPITAATLAIDAFGPNAVLQPRIFVTIDQATGPAPPMRGTWTISSGDLAGLDSALQAALAFVEEVDPGLFQTVHLKQLRDPGAPDAACYQAIVEGKYMMSNPNPIALPPAQITLEHFATLSIATNLGLDTTTALLQPLSQFAMTCDFRYAGATTIFDND
jgi:hypothetical protein